MESGRATNQNMTGCTIIKNAIAPNSKKNHIILPPYFKMGS
jgi:hypothetical protein